MCLLIKLFSKLVAQAVKGDIFQFVESCAHECVFVPVTAAVTAGAVALLSVPLRMSVMG